MPQLVRFLLLHASIGFAVAAVFVAAILLGDPNGLGSLLWRGGAFPVLLLWFFLGLTYGGAQMGVAVMLLAEGGRPARPSGAARRGEGGRLAFARVPASAPRRRR